MKYYKPVVAVALVAVALGVLSGAWLLTIRPMSRPAMLLGLLAVLCGALAYVMHRQRRSRTPAVMAMVVGQLLVAVYAAQRYFSYAQDAAGPPPVKASQLRHYLRMQDWMVGEGRFYLVAVVVFVVGAIFVAGSWLVYRWRKRVERRRRHERRHAEQRQNLTIASADASNRARSAAAAAAAAEQAEHAERADS